MRASLVLAVLVLVTGSGCATSVPTMSELRLVPAARTFAAAQSRSPGAATITVMRDKAFAGGAVDYQLLLDGELIARIGRGEYVVALAEPGERVLEVRHPAETWGTPGDSQSWRLEPAGDYYFRINSDVGLMRLVRTTRSSALGNR